MIFLKRGETLTFTKRCLAPSSSLAYVYALWPSTWRWISRLASKCQILTFSILSIILYTIGNVRHFTFHYCEQSNAHKLVFSRIKKSFDNWRCRMNSNRSEFSNNNKQEHWLLYHCILVVLHSTGHFLHSEYVMAHREPLICFCS